MNDDRELLSHYAAEGSQAAFTELVERRFNLVYSAALRQLHGDAHGARDVAQSVFTDLARKAAEVSRHPTLMGWLYTSVYHAARKRQRGDARRSQREAAYVDLQSPPDSPWETIRPALDREINRLKPAEREALLQRFFAGRAFGELGAETGQSAGAARMRVERALERLRESLERQGIKTTSAALTLALTENAVSAAPVGLSTAVAGQALAQAALTAGTLSTVSFFAMSKLSTALAAAAAAAALGTGVYYAQSGAALRHRADQLSASNEALSHAAPPAEAASLPTAGRRAAPESLASSERSTQHAVSLDDVSTDAVQRETAEGPAMRTAIAKFIDAQFRLGFGPLFKKLDLSDEQITQLSRLNLIAASEREDLFEANRRSGGGSGPNPALDQLYSDVSARFHQSVATAIGPDGAAQYQAYEQTLPARQILNLASAASTYSASPLTAAQSDNLVQLLAQSPGAIDWSSVVVKAQGFLSSDQLAALQSAQARTAADDLERQYDQLVR